MRDLVDIGFYFKRLLKWSNGDGHLEKSDRLLERCSNDRREEKELYTGIQV